mmetsp:Transcript_30616/g.88750  ORF Transcript_30616/g.88750 Transcript_30616/m.88750 type:complete len:227 (-) Transcript_30616:901-1581(-)
MTQASVLVRATSNLNPTACGASLHRACQPALGLRALHVPVQVSSPGEGLEESLLPRGVDSARPGDPHPSEQLQTRDVELVNHEAARHHDAATKSALAVHEEAGVVPLAVQYALEASEGLAHVVLRWDGAVLERDIEVLNAEVVDELHSVVARRDHTPFLQGVRSENVADAVVQKEVDEIGTARLLQHILHLAAPRTRHRLHPRRHARGLENLVDGRRVRVGRRVDP